jgi:putative aldouronate transport system permease protein
VKLEKALIKTAAYAMAVLFSIASLYPFLYVLSISLNDAVDAQRGGIYLWPRVLSLENYAKVFQNDRLLSALGVSLFRVIAGTTIAVLLNAAFSYALSKKYLRGRSLINWIVIIPMFFGGGIIPFFLVLHNLHLTNNLWTYVIPFIYGPFYIVLFRSFFVGLPEALEEAARIDGANDFRIFVQIVLPLSAPVLAAVTLFIGVWNWNDWFVGTAYIFKPQLWTLQNLLYSIIQSADVSSFKDAISQTTASKKVKVSVESLKMAMIIVTVLPIVMIYPFLQKHFVAGVMIGSLKE